MSSKRFPTMIKNQETYYAFVYRKVFLLNNIKNPIFDWKSKTFLSENDSKL